MLVRNVRVVDVVHKTIVPGPLWIENGLVLAVGGKMEFPAPRGELEASTPGGPDVQVVDGGGCYAVPGLLDVHTHIESSFVTPRRFAEAVAPSGTTAVVADPHEIANVLGEDGVRYMLEASRDLPLRFFFSVPSCVPATSAELETSGANWGPGEIRRIFALDERLIALGEMMDFRAVVDGEARAMAILAEARKQGWLVEGHCPSLTGTARAAYFAAGISTDHTLMNPEKIRDEIRLGVWVQLQEKSISPENIALLLELLEHHEPEGESSPAPGGPSALDRVVFVTDDFPPSGFTEGHLTGNVRRAISLGLPPLEALASATIRPARLMGLSRLGALQPGCYADFFLTPDLTRLQVERVFIGGREILRLSVADTGVANTSIKPLMVPRLTGDDFTFAGLDGARRCRVIRANGENTLTELETRVITFKAGRPILAEDLALVAVCERHGVNGRRSLGFLSGYGRMRGAVASTVAHDSHNLVIIGADPRDMALAANCLVDAGGGLVAVEGGEIKTLVPLPVAGLLSDAPVVVLSRKVKEFEAALQKLGVTHRRGLMFLTMVTLTTSPRVKLSDRGLVDVDARRLIPVVEE